MFGMVDPQLAEATIRPVEDANSAEAEAAEVEWTKIAAGIQPAMVDKGQNAALRLSKYEEIAARNPEAVQKLTPKSVEILKSMMEHYQFQVQQEENKMIGRMGARPALEEAGAESM